MSVNTTIHVDPSTELRVDQGDQGAIWIDVRDPGGSEAAIFARTPADFERLADACEEAARRMRIQKLGAAHTREHAL